MHLRNVRRSMQNIIYDRKYFPSFTSVSGCLILREQEAAMGLATVHGMKGGGLIKLSSGMQRVKGTPAAPVDDKRPVYASS